MIIKRPEFTNTETMENKPGLVEADIFSRLLKDGFEFGDFTVEIVKHTWLNYLFRAESEILSMFAYGYKFAEKRLEASCRRAIFYGHTSIKMVKTILIERLDKLKLAHSTDVYGQYTLF